MSTKLWGGRFSKEVDASIVRWTESVTVDRHLVLEDLWGSLAHVSMLGHTRIIPPKDAAAILNVLVLLQDRFSTGAWALSLEREDVHMNVESEVIERLGIDVGGKMHTCRSRNDQVVLDSKLFTRRRLLELRARVLLAVEAFLERAASGTEDVMIGYTHVQHAQPISLAYWLSHYAAVLLRDLCRLRNATLVTDQNPLGAGALAGTSFPIDRELTTELMGFSAIHEHGLDATSSRDFMLETLSATAILETTFSRFAEELIFWSSFEFGTVVLDDAFAMGSSMMPQKKNPGALELLRGRSGRLNGLLVAGLTLLKGLPSGYNRDFHEEKEVLVEALDLANRAVEVVPPLVRSTTFRKERMAKLADENFATATELANYLVSRHGISFRKAHHIVGSLIGELSRKGESFRGNVEVCREHLALSGIEAGLEEVRSVLDPKEVMLRQNSRGGTGPEATKPMLERFRSLVEDERAKLGAEEGRVSRAYEACRSIAREAFATGDLDQALDRHRPQGQARPRP